MLKFVKQSVSTMVNGSRVRLTKDDPWRDDDPVVKAAPQFFVDEPSKVHTSLGRAASRAEAAPQVDDVDDVDDAPRKARAAKKAASK